MKHAGTLPVTVALAVASAATSYPALRRRGRSKATSAGGLRPNHSRPERKIQIRRSRDSSRRLVSATLIIRARARSGRPGELASAGIIPIEIERRPRHHSALALPLRTRTLRGGRLRRPGPASRSGGGSSTVRESELHSAVSNAPARTWGCSTAALNT
jgi:hypothetical protein